MQQGVRIGDEIRLDIYFMFISGRFLVKDIAQFCGVTTRTVYLIVGEYERKRQ